MKKKENLGDGVHGELDDHGRLILTTEEHGRIINTIFLDPLIYARLQRFMKE